MRTGANLINSLICFTLAVVLSACGLFGGGEKAADPATWTVLDSLVQSAMADSLDEMAADFVLADSTLVGVVTQPIPASPPVAATRGQVPASADSLASTVTALVLQRLQGLLADTVVVRIDTSQPASTDSLTSKPVEQLQEGLKNVGTRVFFAILIVLMAFYILQGLLWLLEAIADRSATRRLFFKRLIPIVRMVMWAVVIWFIVTSVFNVDRNGLLAASAALGVGIGLAAQDLIKNLLGGIIIIFDAPFQVGDKVRVGESYGEVKSIGLRSTRIVTLDDNLVSVPNSEVVNSQVANANAGVLDCQVVTTLFLPGWVDPAKAKKIAYEAAANSRYVYLDKPIVVHIRDEFRETFLMKIMVKAYVLDHLYESALATDITATAKLGFLEAGLLYPVYGLEAPHDVVEHARSEGRDLPDSLGIADKDEGS